MTGVVQFRLLSAVYCLIAVGSSILLAQAPATRPATPLENNLTQWVAELDAPDPSTRGAATGRLMQISRSDLLVMKKIVEQARPLSPAQSAALRDIVTHVYLTGEPYEQLPRGFLGVNMWAPNPSDDAPGESDGILVAARVAGFAAYGALLDGDLIRAIKEVPGRRFNGTPAFSAVVSAMPPRTVIHLVVLRQGRQITVPVKLSARPQAAGDPQQPGGGGVEEMNAFTRARLLSADQYFDEHFAGVLGETLSQAD